MKFDFQQWEISGLLTNVCWVEKIFGYLKERGLDPKKEYKIDDKVADIVYFENRELDLVEVEYKSNWKGNIVS